MSRFADFGVPARRLIQIPVIPEDMIERAMDRAEKAASL
jgi:hypothetical protein